MCTRVQSKEYREQITEYSPITTLCFVISSVGEKSLNCIPWCILPLNCCRVFFLLSLILHFLTQKVPKTSAHEKNSHPFLGSGVAMRHPSVEKSLTLNLFFCFTALRNLCGKALLRKYNAPHGKQSSLFPVKQKSLSCVFQRCRFAFGDGLPRQVFIQCRRFLKITSAGNNKNCPSL